MWESNRHGMQRIVLVFVWQTNGTTENLASSLLGKRWVFPTLELAGRVVRIRRMRRHSAVSGILFRTSGLSLRRQSRVLVFERTSCAGTC
jgi:hypothetical protein